MLLILLNFLNFVSASECSLIPEKDCHQSIVESNHNNSSHKVDKQDADLEIGKLTNNLIQSNECEDCELCHAHSYTVIYPVSFDISPVSLHVYSTSKFFQKSYKTQIIQPPIC
jgi:hypothetical protein